MTTHNLATNPRLVKEIDLAVSNQFDVNVICFEIENWSKCNNEKIITSFPQVNFIRISADKSNLWEWIISNIVQISLKYLNLVFKTTPKLISYSISNKSYLLSKYLNKIKNADLVIGHNPGALFATYFAAKKLNCKSGFDVEDYHPGEGKDKYQQHLVLELMNKILPKMSYVSFAAPLIKDEVKKYVHFNSKTNLPIVLNYFSKYDFILNNQIENTKIKLVWFSQNIDFDRGLENIIPILEKYKSKTELHLYGNLSPSFKNEILKHTDLIKYHGTAEQIILLKELGNYDIGLALEPGKDLNNLLALSNKILCFFQSGLYIIATDTSAQKSFIDQHPNHGTIFNKDFSNFEDTLIKIIENISAIRFQKSNRFISSKLYNWETESNIILKNWSIN